MTIATDIQARLAEAWERAERAAPQKGDTYISCNGTPDCTYAIGVAQWALNPVNYRILERAKPKPPEWEAVVASRVRSESHKREVYFRTVYGGWESETWIAEDDELVDPVPLVEMPEREEILAALEEGWDAWMRDEKALGGADGHRADAVLELLERR